MNHDSRHHLFKQYKNNLKHENKVVFSWRVIILVLFFSIWEIASRMYWVDPLFFSSPSEVFSVLIDEFSDGSIISHLQITLFESVMGLLIGTIMGIIIATILWSSPWFSKLVNPYLVIMNAMPKVALGPLIIVVLGPGYLSIIAMGATIPVITTALLVYSAFKEVDPNYEKVLKSFGATKGQIFRRALFPASLPAMVSTLKVNISLSWAGVIVGEFLVSKEGLGYLIIYGFQVYDFSLVISSLILITICTAIMYKIVEGIEGWLIKQT